MKFETRDACKFKKKGGEKKLLYYRYEIHVVLINGKIIAGWYLFYEHKKNRRFKKFSGRRNIRGKERRELSACYESLLVIASFIIHPVGEQGIRKTNRKTKEVFLVHPFITIHYHL